MPEWTDFEPETIDWNQYELEPVEEEKQPVEKEKDRLSRIFSEPRYAASPMAGIVVPTPEEAHAAAVTIGKGLGEAGKAARRVSEAQALFFTGQPSAAAEQIGLIPPSEGELPYQRGLERLPLVPKMASRAVGGLVESTPRLAAMAGLSAAGVPPPAAGALAFGFTEEGFSPKEAAVAAVIPYVGKYSGEISSLLAQRLKIPPNEAMNVLRAAGHVGGPTAYLSAIQASEIAGLPPEDRKQAIINAIESNVGMLALSFPGGITELTRPIPKRQAPTVAAPKPSNPPNSLAGLRGEVLGEHRLTLTQIDELNAQPPEVQAAVEAIAPEITPQNWPKMLQRAKDSLLQREPQPTPPEPAPLPVAPPTHQPVKQEEKIKPQQAVAREPRAGEYRVTEDMTRPEIEAAMAKAQSEIDAAWPQLTPAERNEALRGRGLPDRFNQQVIPQTQKLDETKVETPSAVPTVEGQPAKSAAEIEAETRAAQRGGEGEAAQGRVPLTPEDLAATQEELSRATGEAPAVTPPAAPEAAKPAETPVAQLTKDIASGNMASEVADRAGMMVKSIADLDALKAGHDELRKQHQTLFEASRKETDPVKKRLLQKADSQATFAAALHREAIEAATNYSGSREGGQITKLGERPLDWQKNPEVADWLRKNADDLNIAKPPVTEAPKPAEPTAPAAAPPAAEPAPTPAPIAAPAPEAKPPVATEPAAPAPAPAPASMGGALYGEFAKGQGSPTAMKYRLIDEERAKRGLEPLATTARVSDQAAMDKAMAEIDRNPAAPDELVEAVLEKPRAIEDWESHMLLLRKIDLRGEYWKATRDAAQAYEDSQKFPNRLADMQAASARADFYSKQLHRVEQASRYSGSSRGRALHALQVMAREDYSLESLKAQKLQARNWTKLTPEKEAQETIEIEKIAKDHAEKEKQLDEIEKKQGNAEVDTAVNEIKKEVEKTPESVPTGLDPIREKIQSRLSKEPRADIRILVRKLARFFVSEGTKDRDTLVDQVHGVLADIIPDLARRDTMDLISGYGQFKRLSKDTVSVILRDLNGQMQQIAKLEDMAAKEAPLKTGIERRAPTDEERRLIKQVEEAKKRGGYTVTDPETQLRTALDAVQKRVENQIKDLEVQIATKTKIVKEKTQLQYSPEIQRLIERRNELKEEFDALFPKAKKTEAERLAAWKERTKDRIEELKGIMSGKLEPKQRPKPVELDKEALRIRFDLHTIERLWREKLFKEKQAQRPTYQKVLGVLPESLNVSRALLTSYDFSAPGRQGIIIGLAHPVRAASALKPMFQAWASEKGAFKAAEEIRNRDNAPLYEIGKLYLAEHGGRLSAQEEVYMSKWAQKVPGVRMSERAYTTFLNKLRADSFDAMVKGLTVNGKGNPVELQAIANFINVATGRGGGQKLAPALTAMNSVFFAPKYAASRFQFLAGSLKAPFYALGPKETLAARRVIAKEYARFFAGAAVLYALAQSAGADVESNPQSSDFGKIRLGETRIDPMAGLAQVSTLFGRVITGKTKPIKGRPYPIVGKVPYGKQDLIDVLANFTRGKLNPAVGTGISLRLGKDPTGQKFEVTDLPKNLLMPISYQDMYQAMKEEGIPEGLALGLLSVFGFGVNTYEDRKRQKVTEALQVP